MAHHTHSTRASKKPLMFVFFVMILLMGVSTIMHITPSTAGADSEGANPVFLPLIVKPREFEANLISDQFTSIAHIAHAGDDRLFIVERDGRIRILHPNATITTFLDWRDNVFCCSGEEGMFTLAFHPDYASNGHFFVSYIGEKWGTHWLFVDRFTVSANPDIADAGSAARIFEVSLGSPLHNGGGLAFHPISGNLFLGVGDDQGSLIAQEDSDKGKIIELIVDSYPVVGKIRVAKGLRNPWRLSFDPLAGNLFIGEVGDDSWEEVNLILNGGSDLNFGWPCYEGPDVIIDCAHDSSQPIYAYPHNPARAIIGGPVYRSSNSIQPTYIFGDFATKEIFTLINVNGVFTPTLVGTLPAGMDFLYTFGTGSDGTLYAGSYNNSVRRSFLYEIYIPGVTPP